MSAAKEKLIESAIKVFAEQGYREGKVADIVKGADANIAAVNYHFGSKDQLFVQALRKAFIDANEVFPSRGDLPDSATAEERVAALAEAILRRSFDSGKAGYFNRIMNRTMHVAGSPVNLILGELSGLELDYMSEILTDFLKIESKPLLEWARCNFLQLATIVSKRPGGYHGLFATEPKQEQIDDMIKSQVKVILASLKALSKEFPS